MQNEASLSLTLKEMSEKLKMLRQDSSVSSDNKDGTQDYVEVEDIRNGLIFLSDGSIIQIVEIIPINFHDLNDVKKKMIKDTFSFMLKKFPKNGHFKAMSCETNLEDFINNIRTSCANETSPAFLERVEDYIENTMLLRSRNSIKRRFFYISEYEGDIDGNVSKDFTEIYRTMMLQQMAIVRGFRAMGNAVITYENNSMGLAEILYAYFNPKSYKTEPLLSRYEKINASADYINRKYPTVKFEPSIKDLVAPRGIRYGKWDYVLVDGVYHTFLCLRDISYPGKTFTGWIDTLTSGCADCDIDIHYRASDKSTYSFLLDRKDVIGQGLAMNNSEKEEQYLSEAKNARFIKDLLDSGEDLYNVVTIVTLKANTKKELLIKRQKFMAEMKPYSLHFDMTFLNADVLYRSVMPYMFIDNDVMAAHKRNMTNSSLATLYHFTTFEIFNAYGYALGVAEHSATLFVLDNFNTTLFVNPHISLVGTSGSGKTYIEMMITSRMRMQGTRVIYVLPLKGHEYKRNVASLGGTYIPLYPGSKFCVNIMEIRPEDNSIDSFEEQDEDLTASLLSKKTSSIIAWLRILLNSDQDRLKTEEVGELNDVITKVYADFGITDDNDSIWLDYENGVLKTMPILSDLYEGILKNEKITRLASVLKPWISGSCKNMNGQTNVDLSNKMLAFDINEDITSEELLPAFMYIAFDVAYNIAKANSLERCALILDETWKMLVVEESAKQIFKMIKILRSYLTSVVSATQDIRDFTRNEYGRALLSNSAIKIYLKLTADEIKYLGENIDLSDTNKETLEVLGQGCGFVCFNKERILVDFISSELEECLFTTKEERRRILMLQLRNKWRANMDLLKKRQKQNII